MTLWKGNNWQWDFGEDEPFHTFNQPVEPLFWNKFFLTVEMTGWSQELRLASPVGRRLEYVLGAFASGSDFTEKRDFVGNISADPDPAAAAFIFADEVQDTEPLSYAFFGELDFHLTDTWTLTAGGRWTRDEVDVTVNATAPPGFDPDLGTGVDELGRLYIPILATRIPGFREASVSASEWSWRGGLRWEPTSDLMFYGTAARGFKGPAITALGPFGTVKPEIATNYELGVKAGFLSNRVTAGLTVFHTDVDDFQAEALEDVETRQGAMVGFQLKNAAQVRTRGVEFELSAVPTEQLLFNLGLSYIDAKYESFPDTTCYESQTVAEGCIPGPGGVTTQDLSGRRLPFTPKWSGSAAVNYDFTIPLWSLKHFLRVDYAYKSEINWSTGLEPLAESDAVGVWGLTLGLRSPDERFELVGYVKNLTDEFVVNGLDGGNETIRADLLPEYQRTWGITFSYEF